ncbi:BPI fold-containing family B member 3 [Pteropus vampyrus]|uniref:BPI fold-containing family B member 3 n=1 Tax=Pteropus vampyrus TaxID=132908 RepID=A0A6P3R7L6_PTEVA|nr:BPI fold-containing family B member 3 [Pteropus vampyrus]
MMLGVWSLLLLWSLATPCQGLLETVGTLARIDKDELGKAIQNSLVGGPILQNVLGTVTAVNQGLLGSGGLLGGGGLLSYGGVFGVVEELSGLKIEELTLPTVSLHVLPALGPLDYILCPVVDSVLGVANELLGAVLSLVPLGTLGSVEFTLATLPLISNQYIELDINPIVKSVAGDIIDFPKPPKPIKVPPKEDHTSQVIVPLYLFNTVFGLLQTNGALDIDITPELVPSNVPLTTKDLAALVPEALGKLPPDQQLLLSLRVKEAPTVMLQNKKAIVSIPANIHVLSYRPAGTPEALFELNGVMTLNAQLAPSATKLHLSLSLERLSVKLASSFAHAFDASRLEEWLNDVVRVAYVPKLNVDLDGGIPLPKVLNVNFANAVLDIIENAVVLTVAS